MNLVDELYLFDDVNILSNRYRLLKVGKLLGVEAKIVRRYPIKVGMWRIGKWKENKL